MSYLVCAFWKNDTDQQSKLVQMLIRVPLEVITILQLANKFLTRNRNAFVRARYLSLSVCVCVGGGGVRCRLFQQSVNNSDGDVDGTKMGE
jgi:hypothetical protein